MIRSMTAFARHDATADWGSVTWELRSVNHRYLEVSLKLPEPVRALETAIRERIAAALGRGKIDGGVRLSFVAAGTTSLALNRDVAAQVLAVAGELEQLMGPGSGLRPVDVLRWPGVVSEPETDGDALATLVMAGLDTALKELVATRRREGDRIAEMLASRCQAMSTLVTQVRALRPQILVRLRERWRQRIADLGVEADPGRLEQELAMAAQRLDVDEELDRLDAHLAEIAQVIARKEPVGRRLDFLMQELNREANTLSSKSADADSTRAAVDLKVLIEQMREQVQNVE